MIEVKNLTLTVRQTIILKDVNMICERGTICGLIGRNGSGKTMLMKCICGFVRPTEGEIVVDGKRIGRDRDFPESVGLLIENPAFIPYYSGMRNLKILAGFQGKIGTARIRSAMERTGLDPDLKRHVGKYSLGMRQRLGLAQAIMEDPDLYVLDEPMNGLDREGIHQIRDLLLEEKKRGKTILLASHSMEDIDCLCDQVYRMEEGRLQEKSDNCTQSP